MVEEAMPRAELKKLPAPDYVFDINLTQAERGDRFGDPGGIKTVFGQDGDPLRNPGLDDQIHAPHRVDQLRDHHGGDQHDDQDDADQRGQQADQDQREILDLLLFYLKLPEQPCIQLLKSPDRHVQHEGDDHSGDDGDEQSGYGPAKSDHAPQMVQASVESHAEGDEEHTVFHSFTHNPLPFCLRAQGVMGPRPGKKMYGPALIFCIPTVTFCHSKVNLK